MVGLGSLSLASVAASHEHSQEHDAGITLAWKLKPCQSAYGKPRSWSTAHYGLRRLRPGVRRTGDASVTLTPEPGGHGP
eukprot:15473910-Alexandrium_andersonii.AAC.1